MLSLLLLHCSVGLPVLVMQDLQVLTLDEPARVSSFIASAEPFVLRGSDLVRSSVSDDPNWTANNLAKYLGQGGSKVTMLQHASGRMLYRQKPTALEIGGRLPWGKEVTDTESDNKRASKAQLTIADFRAAAANGSHAYVQELLMALSAQQVSQLLTPAAERVFSHEFVSPFARSPPILRAISQWRWELLANFSRDFGMFRQRGSSWSRTTPTAINGSTTPLDPLYNKHSSPMAVQLWLSTVGAVTPAHHDWADNFYAQVSGRKKFMLLPPGAFEQLSPFPDAHPSRRQVVVEIPIIRKI